MRNRMLPENIDSSWHDFLNGGGFEMIDGIAAETGDNINPEAGKVLRFLKVNLDNVKVVILGQDPYPQKGAATGRAFEVGGLTSWLQNFKQVSLKNIVRLIYKSYNRISSYEDILPFKQIQREIETGRFPILPPDKLFESWENQGVLLLNTSFTCIPGVPGSHELLWHDFSCRLLSYISSRIDCHWFLWGKSPLQRMMHIKKGIFHISRHPMLCSSKYDDDFLKSDCFLKTFDIINWLGL
ncbi:MAG: uracil-DNA glycosylase [Clostridiaceae bacterium]|nr:uracil-DNA glycosylase [Clostridiaceae bacterium]